MKLFFFLLFPMVFLSGQNFTVIYELKYKPQIGKDFITENFYLDVDKNLSVFRSEYNRESDSLVNKTGFGYGSKPTYNNQFDVLKNSDENTVFKMVTAPMFVDVYFIKPDLYTWNISSEKMIIANLECQKADTDYGGRKWTAWFTSSIPLSDGPYIFGQLPGLIVKISDENSDFVFDLVKVKQNKTTPPYVKKKGKEISWDDFKKLQKNYYDQPFSELRSRNIPMGKDDGNGNTKRLNETEMKQMENRMRKQIKDEYNPLELNYKVDYDGKGER
ncbi:GLPGLI family protein [Chryseobacterium foetidum]|uniref:GLPGLI family protein n=1 Tax=Chryseobacterium foetidum TaxID=2951057 RepID=UPI0021C6021A|nr:GLPGLI family protein [Chryseobacterium foetidum]